MGLRNSDGRVIETPFCNIHRVSRRAWRVIRLVPGALTNEYPCKAIGLQSWDGAHYLGGVWHVLKPASARGTLDRASTTR